MKPPLQELDCGTSWGLVPQQDVVSGWEKRISQCGTGPAHSTWHKFPISSWKGWSGTGWGCPERFGVLEVSKEVGMSHSGLVTNGDWAQRGLGGLEELFQPQSSGIQWDTSRASSLPVSYTLIPSLNSQIRRRADQIKAGNSSGEALGLPRAAEVSQDSGFGAAWDSGSWQGWNGMIQLPSNQFWEHPAACLAIPVPPQPRGGSGVTPHPPWAPPAPLPAGIVFLPPIPASERTHLCLRGLPGIPGKL